MLANLSRLQAEERLQKGDVGSPEAIGRLVALASGDEEQGKQAASDAYSRQLVAQVERDCAKDHP